MLNINKILRSPEPNDGAMTEVDPFSEAAGGYDTSFPVLAPDQILPWKVISVEKKTNPEKHNEYIQFKLELTKEARFKDGKTCRPGFKLNQACALTETENYSTADIKRNLALWIKAIFGVEKASTISFRSFIDNPAMANESILAGKTSIKKASGSFSEGSQVSPIIPAN